MRLSGSVAFLICLWAGAVRAADPPNLTDQYRSVADKLIDAALADEAGYNETYHGYGTTVVYRSNGASRAAALGAVAALVRSVTPLAMQIPHTGSMRYDESQPKIPAAAVSPEDAMMMAKLVGHGTPVKV